MTDVFEEHRHGLVRISNDENADPAERALARASYVTLLPERTISRCPISGDLVRLPFDDVDLDGPFWDSMDPARRSSDDGLPPSLVSWTGGLRIGAPLAPAPFMALPGPAVPFVVDALLDLDGVIAVVAPVSVGPHAGFSIAYFADDHRRIGDDAILNEWGARSYRLTYRDGSTRSGRSEVFDLDYEYEVERRFEDGRLRWVAPGDDSWTIRSGREGCPFLGLEGVRDMQRIIDGKIKEF